MFWLITAVYHKYRKSKLSKIKKKINKKLRRQYVTVSEFIYRCSEGDRVQDVKEVIGEYSFSMGKAGEQFGCELSGFQEATSTERRVSPGAVYK